MEHSLLYTKSYLSQRLFGVAGAFSSFGSGTSSLILNDSEKGITFAPFLAGYDLPAVLEEQPLELRMVPTDDFVKDIIGEAEIPVLFKRGETLPSQLITLSESSVQVHFDLPGTIFYILNRIEEMQNPVRDEHDRFPASASHAFQNNYLHRPVVDELIEVLWRCIKHLWPGAERKQDVFSTMVTHDVDTPFEHLFRPAWKMVRSFGSDILRRRDPGRAFRRLARWFDVRYAGNWERDPFYTFESIMAVSEAYGLKSAFYFLADCSSSKNDNYDLNHPRISALMKRIHERGHEIGYHGGYFTYLDSNKTVLEVRALVEAAEKIGIKQSIWGGRQHYLRWSAPVTWRNYFNAGLSYDTTLSYADCAGFRCGTCHPFQPFDVERGGSMGLFEYPLTVMECSLLGRRYMGLSCSEGFAHMLKLKNSCRKYKGKFVLLWHNSQLVDPEMIEIYRIILEE